MRTWRKVILEKVQSHPPYHGRSTFVGFRRYAHAQVITDPKKMADYHKERILKASEKAKRKIITTAYKRLLNRDKCWKKAEKLFIETQNKFIDTAYCLH